MSIYQGFADVSGSIEKEGQEITIQFTRNSDGTGTITWNIPPPSQGCATGTQAYNGIVVTIDKKAANYITTSPSNGIMYNGDPTADPDLNVGSKLDTALVIGAFYNDKTTTSLKVSNIDPNTFYYVSGYAVDNVGTYHREGVHAYSLPTGVDVGETLYYNAYQDIILLPRDSATTKITEDTLTGLDKTKTYPLHILIDGTENKYLQIQGSEAQSYRDLVTAINNQFKLTTYNSYNSPLPPHANELFLNLNNSTLNLWNGSSYSDQDVLFSNVDPSLATQGVYWLNPDNNIIKMYETGGWTTQSVINYATDPTMPSCGTLWFNGTDAYEWDGDHWCKLCLYIQSRNPSLAPLLDCTYYWYNIESGILTKWSVNHQEFEDVLAIISDKDPNTLGVGDFWFNETDGIMYKYSAGMWNVNVNTRYDQPNAEGDLDYPTANGYWLNPVTQEFFKRDSTNTYWIPTSYTMYPTDPMIRSSCELWWNKTPSVDTLYAWDIVDNEWKAVSNFIQQVIDPSLPPNLPNCAVWYNPTTQKLMYILGNSCSSPDYINYLYNPIHPVVGTLWHNTTTDTYSVWNGTGWDSIKPLISTFDPYILYNGYYWFNPDNNVLNKWNGTAWINTPYSITTLVPEIGTQWLNTSTTELYQWNGTTWIVELPIITVQFKYQVSKYPSLNGRPYLFFLFNRAGCGHSIRIMPDADGIFALLPYHSVIYDEPKIGTNGPDPGSMYEQIGVGTDGSPDERRILHETIRTLLGNIGVQVELTKTQIDQCIDNALLMFRRYSSYAYTRNFFWLDAQPNQQTYVMASHCVGFNKITNIRAIYRMRAGWIRTGLAGNELFGIAALQQLYSIGTFDMLSYHLMSSYMKELEQLFATRIMFQWVETTRELRLFQRVLEGERLLIDGTIERTEQDILTNRASALWIQSWALTEAKRILSQVRGKYLNLPGPNGSTNLNAQDLASQAETERTTLLEELHDPAMGNLEDVGLAAHFVIG